MTELETFRADFALVWKQWMALNNETAESYRTAGKAVMERMTDPDWMSGAMAHFAKLADAIRRDLARSERIRAEMRTAKKRAAK